MAFNGTWRSDRGDNCDKLMEKMGVSANLRKLAECGNAEITIEQNGDKFIVKEPSNMQKKEREFTLGVPYEFSMADGTEVSGTWNMDGNVKKGKFTRKDNGQEVTITREIIGGELVQCMSYDGVEAKRFFKKVA